MLDAIQGTWLPITAELGGNAFPEELRQAIRLVIEGDIYTVTVGPAMDKGRVALDSASTPMRMDLAGLEGPNQGKTIRAIFEAADGQMRICYELNGTAYPTEFKTMPGTLSFLVTYAHPPA